MDNTGISVFAYRLYGHLKDIHGECSQSTDTLSKICNMSVGKISQAKRELVDRGLIVIKIRPGSHGPYHSMTVVKE